jgi:phosphomannomutase
MKKFDVIAFDLDGTLTESKAPLSPDMAELLLKLLQKYKVAVISGAGLPQFEKQFLSSLGSDKELLKNLYVLPTSGTALCTIAPRQQCIYMYTFSDTEKRKILNAFENMFQEIGYQKPEQSFGEIIEDRGQQITFSALGQKAPLDLKKDWDPDHKKRRAMVEVLEKYLPDFSSHVGGSTSIDITRKDIDKADGLEMMMKHLGTTPEKVLYVGDELTKSGNDAPVLTLDIETRAVQGPIETKEVIKELLK